MVPLSKRHMQVRQVPLRHDLGKAIRASLAAASTVVSAAAAKCRPLGCSPTVYGSLPDSVAGRAPLSAAPASRAELKRAPGSGNDNAG